MSELLSMNEIDWLRVDNDKLIYNTISNVKSNCNDFELNKPELEKENKHIRKRVLKLNFEDTTLKDELQQSKEISDKCKEKLFYLCLRHDTKLKNFFRSFLVLVIS